MPSIADGSFRDPHSRLHAVDDRIVRTLDIEALEVWNAASSAGLIETLMSTSMLVPTHEVALPHGMVAAGVLESNLIEPITYPFEWSFSMLKDAALLTIDVSMAALAAGFELKDASAYNVVFDGCAPRFVDVGSIAQGFSGHWRGYAQFVDHFLGPLLLTAHKGIPFHRYFRGHLDGIPVRDIAAMFTGRQRFKAGILKHVTLRSSIDRRSERLDANQRRDIRGNAKLPTEVVLATMLKVRSLVERLEHDVATEWSRYADELPYTDSEHAKKRLGFSELLERVDAGRIAWDVGANDGTFADLLTGSFERVLALDVDEGAVDRNYRERRGTSSGDRIVPAVIDVSDLSAGRGWDNVERMALRERAEPSFSSWLAVVHHLTITEGIPFELVARTITQTSDYSIVEWVDRSDPQVELLLSGFADGDRDYSETRFRSAFDDVAEVVDEREVSPTRRLILYRRR